MLVCQRPSIVTTVPFKENWGNFSIISENDPVAGRNPAPVDRWFIPLFTGFYTFQVVSRISEPSTVPTTFLTNRTRSKNPFAKHRTSKIPWWTSAWQPMGPMNGPWNFNVSNLAGFLATNPPNYPGFIKGN